MTEPPETERREWWIFYIDPTEGPGASWKTAGCISAAMTADEAIRSTVGRMFQQPFWAFALDKGPHFAYYNLHYPNGKKLPRRNGPSGYKAES